MCWTAGSRMNSGSDWTAAQGMSWSPRILSHSSRGFPAKASWRIGSWLLAVVPAQEPGAEARVVRHVGPPDGRAELGPESLVAAGEEEPLAISRLVESVGRSLAKEGRLARIGQDAARLQRQHALEQRGLDVLASPRALADEERCQDGLGGERARVVVGDGDAHELRWPAKTLEVLDAAHGLQDRIVARPIPVGTVGAEGGDGAVSQPGM